MKSLSQSIKRIFFSAKCSICGKIIENESGYICRDCFKRLQKKMKLRNIDDYYYLCYYDDDIKKVIKEYKLKNRKGLSVELAYLSKKYLKELIKEKEIDIVLSVPVSTKRIRERGFNQVDELLDKMKIEHQQIERVKNTKHMYSLRDEESRRKNIQGAFFNENIDVNGKNLLIVDDIITTGSTVLELANEVKRNGKPKNIYVFAIAMSTHFRK